MTWDPLQREVLAAMGHDLLRLAPDDAAVDALRADALQCAVLRAAARTPDAPDAVALCRSWGPSVRLRDAAAKRALWPRLRGLRARA